MTLLTLLLLAAEPVPAAGAGLPIAVTPLEVKGFTAQELSGWTKNLRDGLGTTVGPLTLLAPDVATPEQVVSVKIAVERVRTRYQVTVTATARPAGTEFVRLAGELSKQEDLAPWLYWAGTRVGVALNAAPPPRPSYVWPIAAGAVTFAAAVVASVAFVNAAQTWFTLQAGDTWSPTLAATGRTQLTVGWIASGVGLAGAIALGAWLFRPFDPPGVTLAFLPSAQGATFSVGGRF